MVAEYFKQIQRVSQ